CQRNVSNRKQRLLACAHVRDAANEPLSRRDDCGGKTADSHHGMDRLLPLGSRGGGKRYARHQAAASVSEGRAVQIHASGEEVRRGWIARRQIGNNYAEGRITSPDDGGGHWRYGDCVLKDLRHRSLASLFQRIHGAFVLLELRRVSGAAGRDSVQAEEWRKERVRAHAQWF